MKKTFGIIKKILEIAIITAAVAMMIFTIFASVTFDKNNRSIFGMRIYVVMSDSMKATDFAAGDVIFSKKVDPETLKEGDIITFQSTNSDSFGETITHKIRETGKDSYGNSGFVTYGTTTGTNDEKLVSYSSVYGKYVFRIPKLGRFFQYLKTTPGYITCILIPFLILIGMQGLNCIKAFKLYREEQLDKLEAEKAEIEAKRLESQRMMEEILALKEELARKNDENKD